MKHLEPLKNLFLREILLRFKWLKNVATFFVIKKIGVIPRLKEVLHADPRLIKKLQNLRQEGFVFLENLVTIEDLDKIIVALHDKPCTNLYHPHLGSFSADNPPPESHLAHYAREDIVPISAALKIANNEEILALVQGYLGCKPVISNLLVWWSYPERKKPEYAQLYHRDFDDIRFIKLFVYLTDVDENSGPHVYIKNTVNANKFRRPTRLSDEKIAKNFPLEDKVVFCGKKGTVFLEDTFGLHKGQLPYEKKRLILQVEYAVNPLLGETYKKVAVAKEDKQYLDPYVNQLLVDFAS